MILCTLWTFSFCLPLRASITWTANQTDLSLADSKLLPIQNAESAEKQPSEVRLVPIRRHPATARHRGNGRAVSSACHGLACLPALEATCWWDAVENFSLPPLAAFLRLPFYSTVAGRRGPRWTLSLHKLKVDPSLNPHLNISPNVSRWRAGNINDDLPAHSLSSHSLRCCPLQGLSRRSKGGSSCPARSVSAIELTSGWNMKTKLVHMK